MIIGLPSLHAYGDSQVIVNWVTSKVGLSALDLEHWCNHIVEIKNSFLSLFFQHVYRKHNKSVDRISKESLSLNPGCLSFLEFSEGVIIGEDTIHLF